MIPLFKVFMNNDHTDLINVLDSGFITQGKKVEEFENELKKWFNYPYILTLNSATSGLTLALRLLSKDNRDEILSTPLTCTATNWPILANNYKIKWVDVDPNNCNMNLDDLQNKINENTRAIMLVHWGGNPINLDKLHSIRDDAEKKYSSKIDIIEDCAHSFGAKFNDKFIGTFGNMAVFSLQAIKHLTTGDGGLIFLPNEELYERAKLLRWYGISREERNYKGKDFRLENDIKEWGYKYHMNDINATIGLSNLPFINDNLNKTRYNMEYYNMYLNKRVLLENNKNSACWIYTIRVPNRDEFIGYMKNNCVMVSQVHNRNDIHSCVNDFKTELPLLDKISKNMICIPVGWWLEKEDLEKIVNLINKWCNIEIRDIRGSDCNEYLSLLKNLNGMDIDINEFEFDKKLDLIYLQNSKIIVAIMNNKIIASAKLIIEHKFYDSVGHIEDVIVDEKYRNWDIGSTLLSYLINYCKKSLIHGCYKIVLNAKDELSHFYKMFKKEGSQFVYRFK